MSDSDQGWPRDPMIRIAEALERLSPPPAAAPDLGQASAFVWHTQPDRLEAVPSVNRVALDLLVGINRSRDTLLENTRQFARGMAANNALLWGARGMGEIKPCQSCACGNCGRRLAPRFGGIAP